jgi:RNA polymerase sigma-70 factor (ECF subfamily)
VIKPPTAGHYEAMGEALLHSEPKAAASAPPERIRHVVDTHFDFIWRSLRRLGVLEANVDDAAQQVFLVAAKKLGDVSSAGERGFLFAIALRVAADERRTRRRRPEVSMADAASEVSDPAPSADLLLEQRQARALIDDMLEAMPLDLRTVFVLFEMEDLTTTEIAQLLDLPMGTVASRLRRARDAFQDEIRRFQARTIRGGSR